MTARSLSTVLGKGTVGPAQADREQNTALKPFIGFQIFGQNVNSTISTIHSLSNIDNEKTKSLWSDAGEQAFISGFAYTEQLPKIGALQL